jgi:hypothetical protein
MYCLSTLLNLLNCGELSPSHLRSPPTQTDPPPSSSPPIQYRSARLSLSHFPYASPSIHDKQQPPPPNLILSPDLRVRASAPACRLLSTSLPEVRSNPRNTPQRTSPQLSSSQPQHRPRYYPPRPSRRPSIYLPISPTNSPCRQCDEISGIFIIVSLLQPSRHRAVITGLLSFVLGSFSG